MKYLIIAAVIVLFSSCAHGVNVSSCIPAEGHIYGFWGGLWHGIIAPFDLLAMIWSDTIVVYAPNNNGGWYAFGFCLGAGIILGGSSKAANRKQ
jgi:hypothetical protein